MPQLALSHETSADGKTVTIKLRPGVKFQDGEPFDAAAAKYSLDRHLTMKGSFRKPELGSVDKVEVVDPMTIKLILKEPFSPLLAQLTDRAGMMVSPKAAEAAGDKFGLHPVCAGPYKFVERVQQDRIVVEKFADYWNKDNVFIDKITYLPIVDGTVRLANLRSGGLDLIERVLATDIKTVRDNPKLKLIKAVSLGYLGITMNLANGPKADNPLGKDARVRRAFELSIDREASTRSCSTASSCRATSGSTRQNYYYQQAFPIPKRDVAKAKALLKEAGVSGPLDARLHGAQRSRDQAPSPRSCSRWRPRPASTSRSASPSSRPRSSRPRTATTSSISSAGAAAAIPTATRSSSRPAGRRRTTAGYCNKEVDAAHAEARAKSDPAERKKAYEKVAAKFLAEGSILYLYHTQVLVALSDKVEGYKQMPDGLVRVVGVKLK